MKFCNQDCGIECIHRDLNDLCYAPNTKKCKHSVDFMGSATQSACFVSFMMANIVNTHSQKTK